MAGHGNEEKQSLFSAARKLFPGGIRRKSPQPKDGEGISPKTFHIAGGGERVGPVEDELSREERLKNLEEERTAILKEIEENKSKIDELRVSDDGHIPGDSYIQFGYTALTAKGLKLQAQLKAAERNIRDARAL